MYGSTKLMRFPILIVLSNEEDSEGFAHSEVARQIAVSLVERMVTIAFHEQKSRRRSRFD